MEIRNIYKRTQNRIFKYNKDEHSLNDIKQEHILGVSFFVEVEEQADTNQNKVVTNLSELLLETSIGKCSDWDDVELLLTPAMCDSYSYILPNVDNPAKAVRFINPLNTSDFEVGYTHLSTPEDRNIKIMIDKLTDLVITKKNTASPFNLSNCICTVNGLVSRPYMYNDELIVKHGMSFMYSTHEFRHPSVGLLDFSELGGMEIIPFSSCTRRFKNEGNIVSTGTDIEFILPQSVNLTHKTIFPVVANTLYFPHIVQTTTTRSLVLKNGTINISNALLKKAFHTETYLDSTYIIKPEQTALDYIATSMMNVNDYSAFFIVVNTNPVQIYETPLCHFAGSVESSVPNDGILFDQTTRSILDYTQIKYANITDVYRHRLAEIFEIDTFGVNIPKIAMTKNHCAHVVSDLKDHSRGNFKLLRIFGI